MVEGQIRGGEHLPAVLAGMIVASIDVGTRKRYVVDIPLDLDVAEQPNDRRQLEAEGGRADLAVVRGDHLDLPLAPERDRFLPVDDLQGLVGRVQEERLLHNKPE